MGAVMFNKSHNEQSLFNRKYCLALKLCIKL